MLAELRRAEARFLVVGAHALAAHGVPRATVDLNVWIDASPENVRRVWAALAAFGAPLSALKITEADLTRPDTVAQFGRPPWRIDILTGISGVTFDEAWPERIEADLGDVSVPFIGPVHRSRSSVAPPSSATSGRVAAGRISPISSRSTVSDAAQVSALLTAALTDRGGVPEKAQTPGMQQSVTGGE